MQQSREVNPIADYMTKDTKQQPYLPFPRFLLEADLALTTKLVYPIVEIANAIDRSPMTVKNSLNELENAGLIERQRRGQSLPNCIYIKIPDGQDIVRLTDKKLSVRGKDNCPSDGQKTIPLMDRKLSTNKLTTLNEQI